MPDQCLFCRIVAGEIAADKVLETDTVLVFRDIRPVKAVHVLVIPKQHIEGPAHLDASSAPLMGDIFLAARDAARQLGIEEGGYRLVMNKGAHAGQSVFHMHLHLLGGEQMGWPPG